MAILNGGFNGSVPAPNGQAIPFMKASQPAIHQVIRELLRGEPDTTLWLFNGNI